MFSSRFWRSICIGIFGTACVAAVAYFLYNNFHVAHGSMPSLDHSKDGASTDADGTYLMIKTDASEAKVSEGDPLPQGGNQHSEGGSFSENSSVIDSEGSSLRDLPEFGANGADTSEASVSSTEVAPSGVEAAEQSFAGNSTTAVVNDLLAVLGNAGQDSRVDDSSLV